MDDLISRQAAIEAPERFIKDCNPEHFVGHQKFIEYMDNAEIGSFGNWQFANGFNMGLTAAELAIEKLPSAQPERKKGKWIPQDFNKHYGMASTSVYYYPKCSMCGESANYTNFCPNCGADMRNNPT